MSERITRTVRLPLEKPDDEVWKFLRMIACKAARFGNLALADLYVAVANGVRGDGLKVVQNASYSRMRDELSSHVRGAMLQVRVRGYWKAKGQKVLGGWERPACFSADRSLTIYADQRTHQGALYERDGEDYILSCRFEPVEIRDENGKLVGRREPVRLKVALDSPGARKDLYIREAVESIWSGAWLPGTVTIRFDRMKHKIDAMISYSRPAPPAVGEGQGATLGPYKPESGELWLRFDSKGKSVNFARRVNRMRHVKEHHEGMIHRLRRKAGNQRGGRRHYMERLDQVGSFAEWCKGKMHQLSAEIVKACQGRNVAVLRIDALGEGDLPWHELAHMLAYKCEQAGIKLEQPDPKQDATYRAKRAEIGKRARQIKRAKRGIEETKRLLRADDPGRSLDAAD